MATGDFDAAICSHNQLKTIPLSPDVEREVLERRLADFETFDPAETLSRSAARRWARQLEKEQARLAELKQAVEDPAVTYFDRMGVGMLVVDEAHLAKNIRLNTQRQGLPMPAGSQRAEAILARTDYVRSRHGDGAIVMATATPVTNSPAEMWVAARLVAPHALADAGLDHFDAMAANFLAPVETVEHGADGKLKVVTRLGEYKNFPDLARMFRSFADVRTTASLGFAAPRARRRQSPRARRRPHPATGDGRRLVRRAGRPPAHRRRRRDPRPGHRHLGHRPRRRPAPGHDLDRDVQQVRHPRPSRDLAFSWDEPNEKLITAADRIAEIHHRTRDWTYPDSDRPGAAQVVFCDAGVPNPDGSPSVYSTLTDLLVERGIARSEIGWVHDITDPNRRQPLWDQVRSGHTRILIGSTMQMGVGVNIQTRLYAAHELTAPYRPDWLEQAEGRLIRQGNHNPTVEVHRYVTERTADANSWQILQRKAHFIAQAMSDPEQMTRDLRDESVATVAEEFATIAAIATGDQRHIELAALTAATTRLERAERAHHASRDAQGRQIGDAERTIGRLTDQIAAIDTLRPHDADPVLIGQRLLRMRWSERTTLQLAGVTYDAHRADGIRLEIPGTGIWTRIAGDRLHPADEGRGLGQRILNLHDRLPALRAERVELIERARRQIDAERARPVPAEFPRRAELLETRQRRDQLRAELMPKPEPDQHSRGADAAASPTARRSPTPAAGAGRAPGVRAPATAHRGTLRLGRRLRALQPRRRRVGQPSPRRRRVGRRRQRVQSQPRQLAHHPTTRHRPVPRRQPPRPLDDTAVDIEPRHPYAKNGDLPDLHRPTRTHRPDRPVDVAGRPTQRRRRRTRRAPRPRHRPAAISRPAPAGPLRTMNHTQRQSERSRHDRHDHRPRRHTMNVVAITGRLVSDVAHRHIDGHGAVAEFRIAVDGRSPIYLTVETWGHSAGKAAAHLTKGRRIAISRALGATRVPRPHRPTTPSRLHRRPRPHLPRRTTPQPQTTKRRATATGSPPAPSRRPHSRRGRRRPVTRRGVRVAFARTRNR